MAGRHVFPWQEHAGVSEPVRVCHGADFCEAGKLDAMTSTRLNRYQRQHGMTATGEVGEVTQMVGYALCTLVEWAFVTGV